MPPAMARWRLQPLVPVSPTSDSIIPPPGSNCNLRPKNPHFLAGECKSLQLLHLWVNGLIERRKRPKTEPDFRVS